MKRWKKGLVAHILFVLLLFVLAACNGAPPPDERERGSIAYSGSASGAAYDLPQGLFQEGVDYPTEYIVGEGAQIPLLKASCVEGAFEYTFLGWYCDLACTQAFVSISPTQEGGVTVYAKLAIATWSGRL